MTPPRTKKLFISYRSSDAAKVDKIARDLALLRYDDGIPRYIPWQDKHSLPPASPNWWDAIVDAIVDCHMFVFNLSRASLQSEVCRAELDYAHKRNRPIIPIVLDGEFLLNAQSGKYNLPKETWALVPDWLGEQQFLFYIGAEFYSDFEEGVAQYERNWPRDIPAPRTLNPDSKSVHGSNHALYDAACDYAQRLAFADAEKHFDALVRRNDADYADAAAQWLELLRLYAELIEIDERRSAMFVFKRKWAAYEALFPKEFLEEAIFDPKGFVTDHQDEMPASTDVPQSGVPVFPTPEPVRSTQHLVEKAVDKGAVKAKPHSIDLLPAPFAWIEIPGKGYSIAKYPVTNAQFRLFMDAKGYHNRQWWTDAGWEAREQGWIYDAEWKPSDKAWTEPRHWRDSPFNGAEQPVVSVSWYESVAFCLWLSDVTGDKIMLPTEDQWQYAAQGDDGRRFPWGEKWDCNTCNNSVRPCRSKATTPARHYEGKGDSPFGVVDMAGNVWEWCLTDEYNRTNDFTTYATNRSVRGGSWDFDDPYYFRCGSRYGVHPHACGNNLGFRLALS